MSNLTHPPPQVREIVSTMHAKTNEVLDTVVMPVCRMAGEENMEAALHDMILAGERTPEQIAHEKQCGLAGLAMDVVNGHEADDRVIQLVCEQVLEALRKLVHVAREINPSADQLEEAARIELSGRCFTLATRFMPRHKRG